MPLAEDTAVGVKKRSIYLYISFALSIMFLIFDILDFVAMTVANRAGYLPHSYTTSILLGHVVAFYFFLTAYIYINESRQLSLMPMCWVCFVLNMITFIMRVSYEVMYLDYRPAVYLT